MNCLTVTVLQPIISANVVSYIWMCVQGHQRTGA